MRLPGDQFGTQHDVKPTESPCRWPRGPPLSLWLAAMTTLMWHRTVTQLVGGALLSWWPNLNRFTILSGRLASDECGSNSYSQKTGRNRKGAQRCTLKQCIDRCSQFYCVRISTAWCECFILYTYLFLFLSFFFLRALPGNLVEGDMLC